MTETVQELVRKQAKKIEQDCDRASVRDSLISANWDRINLWLGCSTAALAAFAAFSNTNEILKVAVSPLALLAAILGAILTFLAPSEKAATYHKFSNSYHSLRDRIRIFIAFKCVPDAEGETMKSEFQKLLLEKQKVDADHPIVPESYYSIAVEIIERRTARNEKMRKLRENSEISEHPIMPTEALTN